MKMVDWEVARADLGLGAGGGAEKRRAEIGSEFKGSVSLTSAPPVPSSPSLSSSPILSGVRVFQVRSQPLFFGNGKLREKSPNKSQI